MKDNLTLYIEKYDEVWLKIDSDDFGILQELYEYFSFFVPGYKFMPSFKMGRWDGKIRLYQLSSGKIYLGLLNKIIQFCQERSFIPIINGIKKPVSEINEQHLIEFTRTLKLKNHGNDLEARDYQISALQYAIKEEKCIIISPTSSGKSLIIALLTQWFLLMHTLPAQKKILIIVPTLQLIEQMFNDFCNYFSEFDPTIMHKMHKIFSGQEKDGSQNQIIYISTWQSIYKLSKDYFSQFSVVITDEVHQAKADAIKGLIEKTNNTPFRFGLTGTLDNALTHQLVLEGLFGSIKKMTTTSKLIERGQISPLQIKSLILEYPEEIRRMSTRLTYQEELEFVLQFKKRIDVTLKLLQSLEKQNTLVLFSRVEQQGQPFYEACLDQFPDRHVYYIAGSVKGHEREKIKQLTEQQTNVIIIASIGTTSTGVSITNLHNIILLSPSKSKIRVLQSIGRVLRQHITKTIATVYDIVDDLCWKKHKNYTYMHAMERLDLYDKEHFPYKIHRLKL